MAGKILLFIPMYNCAAQIGRTLGELTPEIQQLFAEVVAIDNRSTDDTIANCRRAMQGINGTAWTILRNDSNYSLGGSHKVAFQYAVRNGFDSVVVLHGDNQGSISDIVPLLQRNEQEQLDCLLGGRFMKDSQLINYSAFRTLGNRVFNLLFSILLRRRIFDLGAGLNLFGRRFLADDKYLALPDALTFNYYLLVHIVVQGFTFRFFPIQWKEEDQVSNVKLFRQARQLLSLLGRLLLGGRRLMDSFKGPQRVYSFEIVGRSDG